MVTLYNIGITSYYLLIVYHIFYFIEKYIIIVYNILLFIYIMEISSVNVYKKLLDSNVSEIYHSNSLLTSCLFLQKRRIISRGNVSRDGYYQTSQSSDKIDKKYGIWHDIFFDTVDIHKRASRRNQYGAITFVLDVEILKKLYTGKIWVTKKNPTKWGDIKTKDRWFQNKIDLDTNLIIGNFDQMLVLRHCGGSLPFDKYLKRIIVDNPQQKDTFSNLDFLSEAIGAIKLAQHIGNLEVPLINRNCNSFCKCHKEYENKDILFKMFSPKKIIK